jgi:hypothetical protein
MAKKSNKTEKHAEEVAPKKASKNDVVSYVLRDIEKRDGILTPHAVVDEAKDNSSPLHKYFEWDDNKAGSEYRLWQARKLIANVKVQFVGDEEADLFYNARVVIKNVPVQGYFNLSKVLSDEDVYNKVLREFVKDMEALEKKYSTLKELKDVINKSQLAQLKKSLTV